MRKCSKCDQFKPLDEFADKDKIKGTKQIWCRLCAGEYAREHYLANKDKYKARSAARGKYIRAENKQFVIDYLTKNPCVDCGESDLEVLTFDHIEMVGRKAPRVSYFMTSSLARLMEEIAKCEVRCANCHMRRTRKQMGWSRETIAPLA